MALYWVAADLLFTADRKPHETLRSRVPADRQGGDEPGGFVLGRRGAQAAAGGGAGVALPAVVAGCAGLGRPAWWQSACCIRLLHSFLPLCNCGEYARILSSKPCLFLTESAHEVLLGLLGQCV